MIRFLLFTIFLLITVGIILTPVEYIAKLPLTAVDDLEMADTFIIKIGGLHWANADEHNKSSVIRLVDDQNNEYLCKRTLVYPQLMLNVHDIDYETPLIVVGRPVSESYICEEDGSQWQINMETYIIYKKDDPLSSIPLLNRLLP